MDTFGDVEQIVKFVLELVIWIHFLDCRKNCINYIKNYIFKAFNLKKY